MRALYDLAELTALAFFVAGVLAVAGAFTSFS